MKCKICKEKINLKIFGLPDDICWGCLPSIDEYTKIINKNDNKVDKKNKPNDKKTNM